VEGASHHAQVRVRRNFRAFTQEENQAISEKREEGLGKAGGGEKKREVGTNKNPGSAAKEGVQKDERPPTKKYPSLSRGDRKENRCMGLRRRASSVIRYSDLTAWMAGSE